MKAVTQLRSVQRVVHQLPPLLVATAFAVVPLVTRDDYLLGVWTFILLNVIVVVGLDLVLGYAGQLSLGHGAFVATGAYVSALLTTRAGWSGWAAMPFGVIAAAGLAAVVAIPALRLRGHYLAMATLGVPILFDALIRVGSSWSGGSSGVTGIPRLMMNGVPLVDAAHYYWLVLGFVTFALVLTWNLAISRFGLKLRALHADETAAMARGIPVRRLKVTVFVLSAGLAALSGSLYVHNVQFVAAGTFGMNYSVMLVVMLIAGGMGRIWGGVAGVVLLGWLPEVLRDMATWQPVIFGGLLAVIMLTSPSGLAGLIRRRSAFQLGDRLVAAVLALAKRPQRGGWALRGEALRKRFGGVMAVAGLNIAVRPGEICSIIGPNGAGKSTALALISGSVELDEGRVEIAGSDYTSLPADQRARGGLARTFQDVRLIPSLTVLENLLLGTCASTVSPPDGERNVQRLLLRLGLSDVATWFPTELNHFQRRLAEIGCAMASEPSVLLLDEPAGGLSLIEIEQLSTFLCEIRDGGTAIILVDHNMALVMPLSDRVVVIDRGVSIADAEPRAVIADPKVRSAYLGEGAVYA